MVREAETLEGTVAHLSLSNTRHILISAAAIILRRMPFDPKSGSRNAAYREYRQADPGWLCSVTYLALDARQCCLGRDPSPIRQQDPVGNVVLMGYLQLYPKLRPRITAICVTCMMPNGKGLGDLAGSLCEPQDCARDDPPQ